MTPYVGQELREKLENPLIFQAPAAGGISPPPSKVNGYDVTILIDICKAVIAAETDGKPVNPAVIKQSHVILGASAKAGKERWVGRPFVGLRPQRGTARGSCVLWRDRLSRPGCSASERSPSQSLPATAVDAGDASQPRTPAAHAASRPLGIQADQRTLSRRPTVARPSSHCRHAVHRAVGCVGDGAAHA
jgi:hypothetical protein